MESETLQTPCRLRPPGVGKVHALTRVTMTSKDFTNDCIFNEQMEQHHYNTYSSTPHSNARRTLYLALNKTGQPRKIQIPVNRTLGKLATYTKALTQTVAHDRVEQLISQRFGADHVQHGLNQLCESAQPLVELTAKEMRPRPVCGAGEPGTGKQPKGAIGAPVGPGGKKQSNQTVVGTGKDEKDGLRQKKKKKRRKCRDDEPKPTKKLPAPVRNGTTLPPSGSPTRKTKKPGRTGSANPNKPGPGTKSKLVAATVVTGKQSNPKPASLTAVRTVSRPTEPPFPRVTPQPTITTTTRTTPTAVGNDLQDTSQQSDDSELDVDDGLLPSAELADELDELDEGNPLTLADHATNFVEEEDLDDLEF
uniref:Fibroblast growth factor n=1 Tax=Anopheles farauti TaxID=69004 RepID=A0A182Q4Y1_9DIPT